MENILCIDIGGTSIKYAIYNDQGQEVRKFPAKDTNAKERLIIETIKELTDEVVAEYSLSGVAISSAGVIDSEKGEVIYSGYTIPNYMGTNFKQFFKEQYALDCEIENDVNAACLAEYYAGAARNAQSVVCLTIGTGVGGALMIDGHLVHGKGNTAGEIGYMLIGDRYFQDVSSTTFLVEYINQIQDETHYQNGMEIFEGYKNGDIHCEDAILTLINNLSVGLVNIMYLINPEVIALGGGIMEQKELLQPLIEEAIQNKLISEMFNKTEIKFAENKNSAGLIGAFHHYIHQR
ncbi:ROK family protein [Vagococcus zengguangii]|uniref:ROK family protein n=1 Tax=Vagococcus zengguangii TaxID=2571750 RepID=A0A4D7CZT8_9ENTE|nr:ROK family protein [Vagococcus zengguangii]QCI87240.1 ROK family protein [Vagococcus zengguangii]TLG80744.1 ROK family protein [Vagococcus zengguangii]